MTESTPTVYVVDDDISVRQSLESLISSAGWAPRLFASAEEFLSGPREPSSPRCLVLDVNLPDLNGLELQERVADEAVGMPVIFISGYGDVPKTVRAMKGGALEFLTKPFRPDVLLSAVP
jgi:FixJ family two-component response regulator